jgi:peroxiredoxin
MAEVKVGDTAPDFTLKGIGGKAHTLSEHRGKKSVVLLFYPLDWTPG